MDTLDVEGVVSTAFVLSQTASSNARKLLHKCWSISQWSAWWPYMAPSVHWHATCHMCVCVTCSLNMRCLPHLQVSDVAEVLQSEGGAYPLSSSPAQGTIPHTLTAEGAREGGVNQTTGPFRAAFVSFWAQLLEAADLEVLFGDVEVVDTVLDWIICMSRCVHCTRARTGRYVMCTNVC